jgi:hypothetical protein
VSATERVARPPLALSRQDDGSYVGKVEEPSSSPAHPAPRAITFYGRTAQEVVAQWEDRYHPRPLAFALDEDERTLLVNALRLEVQHVMRDGHLFGARRPALRHLLGRLEQL